MGQALCVPSRWASGPSAARTCGRANRSVHIDFIAGMRAQGIGVGVHYPAMHLFKLFRDRGHGPGDFPVSEDIGARTLTLPLFPAMADTDVDRVCTAVATVTAELRALQGSSKNE